MSLLIPNAHQPGWPRAPKKGCSPEEQASYDRAVMAMQATVAMTAQCHGSDNLSFRALVLATVHAETLMEGAGGSRLRTIPWVAEIVPSKVLETGPMTVRPLITFGPWREDSLGRSRYAFIRWEIEPLTCPENGTHSG